MIVITGKDVPPWGLLIYPDIILTCNFALSAQKLIATQIGNRTRAR